LTREAGFVARWHRERPAYEAWGRHVSASTTAALAPIVDPVPTSHFLKTAVQPRLKDDQKLIEKAFFRKKPYADPYADITDKVGTRFVVLLGSEVAKVEAALTSHRDWTCSKDRDYELEQCENPLQFDYAAVHYVVRNTQALTSDGIEIPAGTPCEVQIKTLLQHAYSELTHDTIYKPQIEATPGMRRSAAKAMALLEATNDYFEKVASDVANILAQVRNVTADLSETYRTLVGIEPRPSVLEGMLLDAYDRLATDNYIDQIRALIAKKPFIADAIRKRVGESNPIFAQPSVLLTYLAVERSLRKATAAWPLTAVEIEPILNDFGESTH
jgi:ppGpp synthetase/RelA/SpoT-type nucleotidyltranferase